MKGKQKQIVYLLRFFSPLTQDMQIFSNHAICAENNPFK